MSHIRTSLPVPTQPWESAKAKFLEGLSQEDVSRFQAANIENVFYSTEVAQRKHADESKIWPLQQRLSSLVDAIDDYGKALDVYANTYGLILSPMWGSIRVIIHIASEAGKFQEKLVDMLGRIGDVLPRFRIYERLYKDHERLLVALSHAYLDILRFCVRTKDFFLSTKRSMIPLSIAMKAAWKPFRQDFDVQMTSFRKHSKDIEKEARLAHRIESARMYEIQLANRALQVRNSKLQKRHDTISVLPTVDYLGKHSKLLRLRHPGTNVWLKSTPQYADWLSGRVSDCLCCYGIPGSGKSILASSVVEELTCSLSNEASIACQYYCDYADVASLDPYCLVGSILKQALQRIPLDRFTEEFQSPFKEGKAIPSFDVMSRFLIEILQDFRTVYIILDGIDEISQENQSVLLGLINDLLGKHSNMKIFVTSRTEEYWIRKAMKPHKNVHLSEACIKDDITLYVQDHLNAAASSGPLSMNDDLKEKVLNALVKGANGMFLWVKFQLLELREALTDHDVNEVLHNLPRDLSETYSRIIGKIHHGPGGTTKIEHMQKVFRWISGSRRPLQLAELEEAIGLETTDKLLPVDRIAKHAGKRLVADCGNLVVCDDEDETVRFAHHTVLQYLCDAQNDHGQFFPATKFDSAAVDDYIGQICLAYLSFADFETQIIKVPTQLGIERDTVDELLWWNVPFGSKLRKAITWVRPSSDLSHQPTPRQVPLILPAYVKASSSWTRKFVLLDYVIAHWAFHTANITTGSPYWSDFQKVALERILLFEFRPWNEPSHHDRLEDTLTSLQSRRPAAQPPLWWHGHDGDMLMYSWAMTHGVPSILRILSSTSIRPYLDMTFADITVGIEERDQIHGLLQFFNAMLTASRTPPHLPFGIWDGTIIYQIADTIQLYNLKLVFDWCSSEYRRWVNEDTTLFDMFYQDALLIAGQQTNTLAFEGLLGYHVHSYERLIVTLRFLVSSNFANTWTIKKVLLIAIENFEIVSRMKPGLIFAMQECLPVIHAIFQAEPDVFHEVSPVIGYHLIFATLCSDRREQVLTVLITLEHILTTAFSLLNNMFFDVPDTTSEVEKAHGRLRRLITKDNVLISTAIREHLTLAKDLNINKGDVAWRRPFVRQRPTPRWNHCRCNLNIVGALLLYDLGLYSDPDDFETLCVEIVSSYRKFIRCKAHIGSTSQTVLHEKFLRWSFITTDSIWSQVLGLNIPEDVIYNMQMGKQFQNIGQAGKRRLEQLMKSQSSYGPNWRSLHVVNP